MADEEPPNETEAEAEEEAQPEEDPLTKKDKEIAQLTDDLKRVQADFENFKKRVEKESAERIRLANQRLITDLLPVLDSFDKAFEDARKYSDPESLRKGLEGLRNQMIHILQGEGLKEIRAEGRLDPFVHEALMREERDDVEDGKILEVYQKGYSLRSRPIRTAKVKVARMKEPEEQRQKEASHNHDNQSEEGEPESETDSDKSEQR
jgi:molecular chaperone GrpE